MHTASQKTLGGAVWHLWNGEWLHLFPNIVAHLPSLAIAMYVCVCVLHMEVPMPSYQNNKSAWPELYIHTIHDRTFDDFPAKKHRAYYKYGLGRPY